MDMRSRFALRCALLLFIFVFGLFGLQPVATQALPNAAESWIFNTENPLPDTGPYLKAWACSPQEFYFSDRYSQILYHYKSGVFNKAFTSRDLVIAIGGSACDDVLVLDSVGRIYHYDGANWSTTFLAFRSLLNAWIVNANAIFGIGGSNIYFYDGATWSKMTNPDGRMLNSIWGSSATDAYAVGNDGVILHYDGVSWTATTSSASDSFSTVWGTASNDVYAVGRWGRVLHYNGANWQSIRTSNLTDYFFGVWSNGTTVFVIGYTLVNNSQLIPLIEQYDGSTWTVPSIPYIGPYYRVVTGSGTQAFVVGESGAILGYDGAVWSELSTHVARTDLTSAWGSGPNDIFAVGKIDPTQLSQSQQNTILHFDGAAWTNIAPKVMINYTDVWGSGPTDVYALGDPSFSQQSALMHYNGAQWTPVTTTVTAPTYALWGSGPNDIFALGNGIHHYDGVSWSKMNTPPLPALYDIWGSGPSDVYAVGYFGVIVHYDGISWTEITGTGNMITLRSIWGSGPNDIYAIGDNNVMMHYNGSTWTRTAFGDQGLTRVWGYNSSDIFVSTNFIWFYHFDGTTWSKINTSLQNTLALWGDQPGQIRLFGAQGQIVNAHMLKKVFAPLISR